MNIRVKFILYRKIVENIQNEILKYKAKFIYFYFLYHSIGVCKLQN